LAVLLDWSEIRMMGVMGPLNPHFGLLVKPVRREGVDRGLEERYCRPQASRW
jgi:hypothetical protein